jgi:hypothetical protein
MKQILIVLVLNLFFACTNNEATVSVTKVDTSRVIYSKNKDSIFIEDIETPSLMSEITCPKCKFRKKEIMPTDQCLLKYTCTNCKAELYPDEKDCCVFCTYGDHKCPSKQ